MVDMTVKKTIHKGHTHHPKWSGSDSNRGKRGGKGKHSKGIKSGKTGEAINEPKNGLEKS